MRKANNMVQSTNHKCHGISIYQKILRLKQRILMQVIAILVPHNRKPNFCLGGSQNHLKTTHNKEIQPRNRHKIEANF